MSMRDVQTALSSLHMMCMEMERGNSHAASTREAAEHILRPALNLFATMAASLEIAKTKMGVGDGVEFLDAVDALMRAVHWARDKKALIEREEKYNTERDERLAWDSYYAALVQQNNSSESFLKTYADKADRMLEERRKRTGKTAPAESPSARPAVSIEPPPEPLPTYATYCGNCGLVVEERPIQRDPQTDVPMHAACVAEVLKRRQP